MDEYFEIVDGNLLRYIGEKSTVLIPLNVECISNKAFADNEFLERVVLSSSIKVIEREAFLNCVNLKEVVFNECLQIIQDKAFYNCNIQGKLEFPPNVSYIGSEAFYNSQQISIVLIGPNVMEIGECAFDKCFNLQKFEISLLNKQFSSEDGVMFDITHKTLIWYPAGKSDVRYAVPQGVIEIAPFAFEYNAHLESIELPESVNKLGKYAFCNCVNLSDFRISQHIIEVGEACFYNCASIEKFCISCDNLYYKVIDGVLYTIDGQTLVAFPPGNECAHYCVLDCVKKINSHAFKYCVNLKSILVGKNVHEIGYEAFKHCYGLEEAILDCSTEKLERGMFWRCKKIKKIFLSANIKTIEESVFEETECLKDIFYEGSIEEWNNIQINEEPNTISGINIHYCQSREGINEI